MSKLGDSSSCHCIPSVLYLHSEKEDQFSQREGDSEEPSGLSSSQNTTPKAKEEVKAVERRSELVFFVEEQERFKLEDLLEATADLQNQTICSTLYKVILKNSSLFAVKRLKKLQVSFEEFGQTMIQIGNLRHPNILPLVGYHSTNEEKLFIYNYQSNGSLLNLLEGKLRSNTSRHGKLSCDQSRS
jgi:hypothetical protein